MTKIWFELKREGLRNGKLIAQNWTTIETYIFPQLGSRRIDEIELNEIADAIRPIWRAKHETAKRTLGRVREIFALSQIRGYRKGNPAQFDAKIALGKVRVVKKHQASLPFERMPEFWDWLKTARCVEEVRQAAMLLILTAKRTGETRKAEWGFFDEQLDIWTTPEELMKMGRAQREYDPEPGSAFRPDDHRARLPGNLPDLGASSGAIFDRCDGIRPRPRAGRT